jgi:serine phosphatase RsbU (regulator of sigma subunit)
VQTIGTGRSSADALLDGILAAVDAWAAGAEQADDITLLAVRRARVED